MIWVFALAIFGYLLGSIPSGLIVGKMKGVDLRQYGSGKTGATNVLRTLGWRASAVVTVADILKGVLPVLLTRLTPAPDAGAMVGALAAVAGHNWSIYIRFQGGRGVNTSLGGFLAMSPLLALLCAAVAVGVMVLSKYASLGSVLGALIALASVTALVLLGREPLTLLIYILLAVALLLFQHRDNIQRLLAGKERKIGQKAETQQEANPTG